jgi:hypothetical protein
MHQQTAPPAPPGPATRFTGAPGLLAEALLGTLLLGDDLAAGDCPQGDPDCRAGDHQLCHYQLRPCTTSGDGCPPAARELGGAGDRTAANVGAHDTRSWPIPGDWPYRLLGYVEACHIWLSYAGWSVTTAAPQHTDPRRQLFAEHRNTANAVDGLLREWIAGGFVRVEGGLPAAGEPYDDRPLRLTGIGYALLRELRERYGR